MSGLQVQYGEVGVSGSRFTTQLSDGNGRYGALLLPGTDARGSTRPHTWYAYVVQNGQQASDQFTFTTDPLYAINPPHCEGLNPDGTTDDDDDGPGNEFLDRGCLLDPCKSNDSVQIKVINWQQQSFAE